MISIVLPVYNVRNYIKRCLNSILSQINSNNRNNIELIIVDDESPDDSILLAETMLKSVNIKPNYKIIHQKNKGLGGARNTGIRNASGEYIWFVDSDDEIISNSISKLIQLTIKNDDIIMFDIKKVNNNGQIKDSYLYTQSMFHKTSLEISQHFLLSQAWRALYRKNFLLEKNLFFREKFLHEDSEFNMRAFISANSLSYLHETFYKYYTGNNNSIMNNIKLKNIQDVFFYFEVAKQIERTPYFSNSQKAILNKYVLLAIHLILDLSLHLSKDDYNKYKILLHNNRKRILNYINDCDKSFIYKLKSFIMIAYPSKRITSFIIYKDWKNLIRIYHK